MRRALLLTLILLLVSMFRVSASPKVTILVFDPGEMFAGDERIFRFLEDNGFSIEFYRDWYVSYSRLKDYKMVLTYDYFISDIMSKETYDNFLKYLENGGGMVVIHNLFNSSMLTNTLNITVTPYGLIDPVNVFRFWDDINIPVYGRIREEFSFNVSRIVVPYAIALVANSPSYPIVLPNDETVAYDFEKDEIVYGNFTPIAGAVYGRGRVVVFGSEMMFSDFYIYSEDNAQFLLNVFCWCSGLNMRTADYSHVLNLTYTYIGIAVAIVLLSSALVAFSNRIVRGVPKWVVLAFLVVNIALALINPLYYRTYNLTYIAPAVLFSVCLLFFALYWNKLEDRLRTSMCRLMIMLGLAYSLISLYMAYFLYNNLSIVGLDPNISITAAIKMYVTVLSQEWIGVPLLWLLFRKRFEEEFIYSEVIELGLPPEGYEDIFYNKLYGNYIYKIMAVILAAQALPGTTLLTYEFLWGGHTFPEDWFKLIYINGFIVFSVLSAIFMLKRAVEYELTDEEKLAEFKDLIFVRELPYTLVMLFVVPAIVSSVVSMTFKQSLYISLLGLFIGYVIGYIAVKIYGSGVSSFFSTIIVAVMFLVYQWIINSTLLKPLLGTLQNTSLSGAMSLVLTIGFKKMYIDFQKTFEKALKARKKTRPPPPPPPPPPSS